MDVIFLPFPEMKQFDSGIDVALPVANVHAFTDEESFLI
jgi:hypothetical protein